MKTVWDDIEKGFEARGDSDPGDGISDATKPGSTATGYSADSGSPEAKKPNVEDAEETKPKGRLDESIKKRREAEADNARRKRIATKVRLLNKHGIRFKNVGRR